MPGQPSIVVILGAGFSRCAGLPLQADFGDSLLSGNGEALDNLIDSQIERFLKYTFGWRSGEKIPALEDIFTMIDLSAGTGHALGPKNPPRKLRALRRLLIYRIFSLLDRQFRMSADIEQLIRTVLNHDENAHFIVLNWDIVLERHLEHIRPRQDISYGVHEKSWYGTEPENQNIKIIKVHGSANWVYCDNCRQIFFDRYSKLSLASKAGITKADLSLFDSSFSRVYDIGGASNPERNCRECRYPVGSHIATFSFRKSFRTLGFAETWMAADSALSQADRWLFVGYSLPSADFEFKHLLKCAELKHAQNINRRKNIDVVVKNDNRAEAEFRQIFGSSIRLVEQRGLDAYVNGRRLRELLS